VYTVLDASGNVYVWYEVNPDAAQIPSPTCVNGCPGTGVAANMSDVNDNTEKNPRTLRTDLGIDIFSFVRKN
jgi:hypothetical protein